MSQNGSHYRKKARKKKKTLRNVLLIILALLVVIAAVGYAVFHHLYSQMNTVSSTKATPAPQTESAETPAPTPDETEDEEPEETEEPVETPRPLTEEEQKELEELELRASLEKDAEEIMYNDDVYNILLIGADGTSDTLERSDAMILLSINKATKEIWLTSLMRDTQVTIPGWGTGHLNWATRYGGEENGVQLLMDTLESEKNFAIHIDNWAMVNFVDFADIAGMLGPITVTVTEQEAIRMNRLILQVCHMRDKLYGLEGDDITPRVRFSRKGGTFEISDGIQILAYCRERKTMVDGHYGDTGRSNKQREVLMAMWENVKKMSLLEQYALAEKVMSIVTTDITEKKCFSLLLSAPSFMEYKVYAQQLPHLDAKVSTRDNSGLSIYYTDFRVCRNILKATIYGQEVTNADLHSSITGKTVDVAALRK